MFCRYEFVPSCTKCKSEESPKLILWLSSTEILWLLVSKSPPSCGDVSPTRSVLTVLPDAAVILPCASTVIEGIDVDDP